MQFMPWTDELLTGIAKVDEQHKWLVDATNQLHAEICKPDADRAVAGQILVGLVDYTFKHFAMEEKLFESLDYPDTDAHFEQHNMFTDNVTTLLMRHNSGETVSVEALDLLKNWLVEHIMKTDKAYVPFLKQKGVV
jgi:hemerythrin